MNWHKKEAGWEAWATKVCLDDRFPPRYSLQLIEPRNAKRKVIFQRYGHEGYLVGVADNLEAAKVMALTDYLARQAKN